MRPGPRGSIVERSSRRVGVLGLAALAAGSLPAQSPSAGRTTLIRTVNAAGEPLAGARIVFLAAPLGGAVPAVAPRFELVSDTNGRARASFDETLVWSAWAIHDSDKTRLASDVVQPVVAGRPLRIELRPFEVPNVRIQHLAPWRQRFGDKLELAFTSAVEPFPTFRVPLPPGDEPALRLPPLPAGNYFPSLVLPDGGLLDARYFSPHFLSEAESAPEELYERAYPLKRVILGQPIATRWTFTNAAGQPVAGARVLLRPEYQALVAARHLTTDAQGKVEIVLPGREMGDRGWFTQHVLVVAPGFLPSMRSIHQPPAEGSEVTVQLAPGEALDWRLSGELPPEASLMLLVRFEGEVAGSAASEQWVRVEVGDGGKLLLPAASAALPAPAPAPFDLWLLRGGLATLLARGSPPRPKLEIDPSKLAQLTVRTRAGDRPPAGGTLYLCRTDGQTAVDAVGYALDREGTARLRLPPGKHVLLAVHESRGAGLATVDVPDGEACERAIPLTPHTTIALHVVTPGDEAVAGATIGWNLAIEGLSPLVVQTAFGRLWGNGVRTDESGRAKLLLPSLAGRGDVFAQVQRESTFLFGNAELVLGKDANVEITVGQ